MARVRLETTHGAAASDSAAPLVSIILPAYQAEATLDRAIASLLKQSVADLEVIVVDDGSTDGTAAVAQEWVKKDSRVRLLSKTNGGASSARNLGMSKATGRWIGFLDSDDWFDTSFLQKLLAILERHPDAGVVYCDFALVDNDGRVLEEQRVPVLSDPFGILARSCVLSVHCALTRSDIMARAGRFDESLDLNEDWDLWQRIARTGTEFRGIQEILAFYYTRPESLSRRPRSLLVDGLEVIDRICRADPAVPSQDPRYANGLPAEEKPSMQLDWLLMCAANAIALGEDAVEYFDLVKDMDGVTMQAEDGASTLLGGLAFALCTDAPGLAPSWPVIGPKVDAFWAALGQRIGHARAIDTARFLIHDRIFEADARNQPFEATAILPAYVDIDESLADIDATGRDTVVAQIAKGQTVLAWIEMPGGAVIPAAALAEVISGVMLHWPDRKRLVKQTGVMLAPGFWVRLAQEGLRSRGWGLRARAKTPDRIIGSLGTRGRVFIARAMADTVLHRLESDPKPHGSALVARLKAEEAASALSLPSSPFTAEAEQEWRDVKVNSPEYWDQVFEHANPWAYDSRYEQTKYEYTLDMITGRPKTALELACAEGHFTVQLADRVDSLLATDISTTAIKRNAERCAEAGKTNVSFDQLDFFNNAIPGSYDLITCSEVLYECGTLPRLKKIARNIFDHLKPGGQLVMAHVIEVSEERDRSGFDWDGVFGAKSIAEVFAEIEGLSLEAQIESEIYRIHRFRKLDGAALPTQYEERPLVAPPEPQYAAYVSWGGIKVTRKEALVERAVAIPILMYHRVAARDDGPESLAQYRVTPEAFEAQLTWLRQNGYNGIAPADLASAMEQGNALPGRPVLLTFDDGYKDFATTAWPILQHHGLAATVAVVTDKMGGVADWDEKFGTPAPLMSWEELQRVSAQGAHVASHSASHRAFPSLSAEDILREAVRSSAAIERAIGIAPDTLVYPYGSYDCLSGTACEMAGYRLGLGTGAGVATLLANPMSMPRVEVNGFDDLDAFIRRMTAVGGESGRVKD